MSPHETFDRRPGLPIMQSPPGATTIFDSKPFLYFAGTDYLGLQADPRLAEAAAAAARQFGVHSATSRLGFGSQPPVLEVERAAAEFQQAEKACYFSSGYLGNQILLSLLQQFFDILFLDELAHASIEDAARMSGLPVRRFAHRDANDLAEQLRRHVRTPMRPLAMSDAVFPVSGRIAPLESIRQALARYDRSALCLDDAHGAGVLGEQGRGCWEHVSWPAGRINQLGAAGGEASAAVGVFACFTASKAIGGSGGLIAGGGEFIARLKSASACYGATTPPAAPVAAATAAGLKIIRDEPWRRERLRGNAARLRARLSAMGLDAGDSPTPVVSLTLGDAKNMERIQRGLWEQGIAVAHIRDYRGAGPEGTLRIAAFATHAEEMIDQLADSLQRLL